MNKPMTPGREAAIWGMVLERLEKREGSAFVCHQLDDLLKECDAIRVSECVWLLSKVRGLLQGYPTLGSWLDSRYNFGVAGWELSEKLRETRIAWVRWLIEDAKRRAWTYDDDGFCLAA
jgi:hypothetical protein